MQLLGNMLLVGAGGFVGSILRYLIAVVLGLKVTGGMKWPLSTFLVNLIGSFLIGILWAKVAQMPESRWLPTLGIAGFCGGFTTFSTFSFEVVGLLRNGDYTLGLMYVLASVFLCVIGTWCGLMLAK